MAVALKCKYFKSPIELSAWAAANAVTTVMSISQDNSGQWVLIYI